jgi:hypothetical protein
MGISRTFRLGSLLAVLPLLALPLVGPRPACAEERESFDKALERYEAWVKRVAFAKRHKAREKLAKTRDARALPILIKDYDKPEAPKDHVRYVLVTQCADHLGQDAALLPAWTGWRKRYTQAEHAWLWYRGTQVESSLGSAEAAQALSSDKTDPWLRSAAFLALVHLDPGARKSGPIPAEAALDVLGRLPKDGAPRAVLAESAVMALVPMKDPLKDPAGLALVERAIELLADPALLPRSKLVVARVLARAFKSETVDLSAELWRRELAAAKAGTAPAPAEPERYARPRFVGLPASGTRLVYVIDASDSMLAPLASTEKESLEKPVTPRDSAPVAPKGADDLPWDKIKTRFDAARECLKASLARLEKDRHFCVVLFGDKAEMLEATPQLIPASPKAIKAAIRELDKLEPVSTRKTADYPHGQLKGGTNLHGGLRKAFQLKAKGQVETLEHVDPKLLEEGCDTIFLLSDGAPSWDDFEGSEPPDPEDTPGNPESKTDGERTPMMTFDGPYGQFHIDGNYLVQDVRRMNLWRNVEIHCVSIGEADDVLLGYLADIGLGQVRRVGAPGAAPAPR